MPEHLDAKQTKQYTPERVANFFVSCIDILHFFLSQQTLYFVHRQIIRKWKQKEKRDRRYKKFITRICGRVFRGKNGKQLGYFYVEQTMTLLCRRKKGRRTTNGNDDRQHLCKFNERATNDNSVINKCCMCYWLPKRKDGRW